MRYCHFLKLALITGNILTGQLDAGRFGPEVAPAYAATRGFGVMSG